MYILVIFSYTENNNNICIISFWQIGYIIMKRVTGTENFVRIGKCKIAPCIILYAYTQRNRLDIIRTH